MLSLGSSHNCKFPFIAAFHAKRIPDRIDAIVIGSGIGGLTTATVLAKSGQRVLVLEQHDQAGGCCHTYIDKGFEFDVGKLNGELYAQWLTHKTHCKYFETQNLLLKLLSYLICLTHKSGCISQRYGNILVIRLYT